MVLHFRYHLFLLAMAMIIFHNFKNCKLLLFLLFFFNRTEYYFHLQMSRNSKQKAKGFLEQIQFYSESEKTIKTIEDKTDGDKQQPLGSRIKPLFEHKTLKLQKNTNESREFSGNNTSQLTSLNSSINIQIEKTTPHNFPKSVRIQQDKILAEKTELEQKHKQLTIYTTNTAHKKKHVRQLKELVKRHKISNIVSIFIDKLRRNNIYSSKKQIDLSQSKTASWDSFKGLELNEDFQKVIELIILIFQISQICIYPLNLTFALQDQSWTNVYETAALILSILDFFFNLITVKIAEGKKKTLLKDIIYHYLTEKLIIDLIFICIILIGLVANSQIVQYFKLLILAKIPWCLERLQKLQIYFIESTYKEQYWSIIKVFLFNFFYAHFLAITLSLVSQINPKQSWIMQKNLLDAPWYHLYIWAYYWSVNMMLTVGFGDIVASNHIEALCLIFVQTLSCIVLAYNINCVGSLISGIRQQDLEKCKKYKIFRSLAVKNKISSDLFLKVSNYIEESNNIKKKFNIEEENKFIQTLPAIFKKDYLSESNHSIFQNIYFFKNLADKAIQSLAQAIEITISHPSQLISSLETFLDLKILKQGAVGYCVKKPGCIFNGKIIDKVRIKEGESPFLVSLNFITNKKPKFQIKSLQYSVIYSLDHQKLIESMKKSKGDYQYYCYLKDKSKHIQDQFQILTCPSCRTNHTKFDCPKLHFIPISQHTINKLIRRTKIGKNKRSNQVQRVQYKKINALTDFLMVKNQRTLYNMEAPTSKKNKFFIIKQLARIERYTQGSIGEKTAILDRQLGFLNSATQSIKEHLNIFFKKEMDEDEIWLLRSDIMQNFKGYFPFDNPGNLDEKFRYNEQQHMLRCQNGRLEDRLMERSYLKRQKSYKTIDLRDNTQQIRRSEQSDDTSSYSPSY